MDIEELNSILRSEADANNICESVAKQWNENLDEQGLIDLWYGNYDFAIVHHFPKNSTIMRSFGKDILRKNNVIIDDQWSLLNPYKAMILGDSTSNIRFNSYHVGTVWVRDNSSASIFVSGHASIVVCIMEYAEVNIEKLDSNASVLIMKYSPTAKVIKNDHSIRIRENFNYLKNK